MSLDPNLLKEHRYENSKVFKKYAPVYDLIEFVVGNIRKSIARSIPANSVVLDVACGTGSQAIELAKQGHRVTGIDLSADMLAKANKKAKLLSNIELAEKDATDTQYEDKSFDVSMISFGLHDMPEQIALAVLKEMKRVTKPGGRIYILDYGQPDNQLMRRSADLICSTWETDHYHEYVKRGIDHYLSKSSLGTASHQNFLFGIVSLTVVELG